MIGLIDYGMGNVGSIQNMLRHVGSDGTLVHDPAEVAVQDRLILPGVGHFDQAMDRLDNEGLSDAVREHVADGKPLLGICLGMQLLGTRSDEGERDGLGLIDAKFHRFPRDSRLTVPHMGWNTVEFRHEHPVVKNIERPAKFYFVHTYYAECGDDADIIGETEHGIRFTSMYGQDNVVGVQFHPEKSHVYGMQLMRNFCAF